MALMFLNGDGMRGGIAPTTRSRGCRWSASGGPRRCYRFYSVRDEFPALYPAADGDGQPILGELYDVPHEAR